MGNMLTQPSPNQIWYTSSDGAVINPTALYFSAKIVSNSYDEGWGIITFNRPVTEIGWNAFLENKKLTSIVFPSGVTEIADGACQGCTALQKVVMPDSVTKIGARAFAGCSELKTISIPHSCTNVGQDAFDSTTTVTLRAKALPATDEIWYTSLENNEVEFRSLLANGAVVSNVYQNGRGVIKFDTEITQLSKNAFYDCTTLTSITLPARVESIGDYAFSGCVALNSVTLPDSLQSIGICAFEGCSALKIIDFGQSLKSIGQYAFARCTALKSFTVPQGIKIISEGLLSGCQGITKLYMGSDVEQIEPYAFEHCNIVAVYLQSLTPKFGAESLRVTMGMKIYVPQAALERYKEYEGWQQYTERIHGYSAVE